ncbi:MAG TPA: HAD family phosphatase [Micromonospora sp.]
MTAYSIAAVLFDMDGTLIDSERLWDVAMEELAAAYGGRLSKRARQAMVGSSMATSMRILHAELDQPWRDPAEGIAFLERRVAELFRSDVQWRPGAAELLREVRAAGIPTALVTSTARRLVEIALDTLGRENFDVVVCGDEVSAPKPDPTPYVTAIERLGVPAQRCVAIEDSPAGVRSAVAAGVTVVAVEGAAPVPPMEGIYRLATLAGVNVEFLASLLPQTADAVAALDGGSAAS